MTLTITIDNNALFLIYDIDDRRAIGTGFAFLKSQWVVTAKHVIVKNGQPRHKLLLVPTRGKNVVASVHFLHPTIDVAILQINGESPCQTPLYPSHERLVGTKGFICCGYAPSLSNSDQDVYTLFVNQITTYEREQRERIDGAEELIIFEAPYMEGGHSGGPILGEGGGCVAIVIEGFRSDKRYYGRATGIHPLLNSLEFSSRQSR